ncbi:Sip1-related alpha-galactosidase [Bifidobacterium pseudocatenulatum]|uniref:Sip1-related alpha-galactosidase n=1 Tax=Bifidobacterium pseudocatenulatum TaxID=28026 RepID=UPI0031E700A1
MIAETCPITVRTVTAHLDTGRAVYGEQASAICELPVEAVTIVPESCEDECTSSAGIQGDAQVRLWRIDVNAHAPQPKDRAAAFQEQQAFEPHHAIDVSLTMAGVDSGNDDTMLALYQHKEWWMRPTWVRTPSELPERTQLLLRRNNDAEDAEWLVLVAICGTDIRADFSGQPATESDDTALRLVLSSNRVGRTTLCDTAAYIACASDPYMAIRAATQTAARQLGIRTRKERPFPDALTGLGWCTWDSLGRDVNEQAIVNKMEEFQAKHVPISWVLIDDGWSNTDRTKETLIDFGADRQRFPHGLAHTIALLKTHYGVRSVGVWQAFQGYWNGVDPHGEVARQMNDDLTRTANGCLLPGKTDDQAFVFWHEWDKELERSGIDFVKVDSQSSTSVMTAGKESYGEATIGRHEGLDSAVARHFNNALINCMGMAPEDYWHRPISPIVRSSDDYLPHDPHSLAEHIMQNAFNALLMGELYHCDWDMFWSEHPHAWAHGIMRLLSGGPVYCSDAEGHTDERMLHDLLDFSGGLARPDAPGLPTADSLLRDPRKSAEALGVHVRFGDRDVTAYVGLCEEHEQEVRLAARRPGRVIRPESGDVRPLQAGETMSTSVSHGEVVIFEE